MKGPNRSILIPARIKMIRLVEQGYKIAYVMPFNYLYSYFQAAKETHMAISTAKYILRGYRKDGRIGPKITRAKTRNPAVRDPFNKPSVRNKYIISYKEKSSYSKEDIL